MDSGPAVLDEMKLELKDMKVSEVTLISNGADLSSSNVSTSDELVITPKVIGADCTKNILNPTSFALIIKRNLSAGWYKELPELDVSGSLESIIVSIKMLILDKITETFTFTTINLWINYFRRSIWWVTITNC